ncbi:MAG: hypothetical protein IJA07_01910 [Agathobacter sp.]|nr:hypothetical protein [Agathobacter sp.]
MAFNGYLLKMGEEIFPLSFVFKESYKVVPNRRQDLDSTRNANGKLQRNVLDHMPSTISFQTKPMWSDELNEMMSFIRSHFSVEKEKKMILEYYCPDTDDYKTGEFYVPDIEYSISRVDLENNKIFYNGFQLEFIEY